MSPTSLITLRNVVFAVAPVAVAALLASMATIPNIPGWYESLAKPSFNPPNWVFSPVWTALYAMMAYAFFRILESMKPGRTAATALFLLQISLNALWSWAFFAAQNPLAGLIVIMALLIAIILTIAAFWKLDHTAGTLLLPYLAWVGFAAILNWEIYRLN